MLKERRKNYLSRCLSTPRERHRKQTPCDRLNKGKIYQMDVVKWQLKGEMQRVA